MEKQSLLDAQSLLESETLANNSESLFASLNFPTIGDESMLTNDESNPSLFVSEEEKQRVINEHNQRVMKSPEYQARVLANQYIANAQQNGIYMTGQQKRTLYKKYLRKAQKGRFNYLFDEEKQRRKQERMRAKFDKLNQPQEYTVDDITPEAQDRLKEMVNEEAWHDFKPANVE